MRSSTPENNTVHAEYYRPDGPGPFPAVIILDVTAGNQMLSRHMGAYFASQGVAGLFVQMAYYGPRRPPGSERRLLSPNVPHTVRNTGTVPARYHVVNWAALGTKPKKAEAK